jgi:hypothetical protein
LGAIWAHISIENRKNTVRNDFQKAMETRMEFLCQKAPNLEPKRHRKSISFLKLFGWAVLLKSSFYYNKTMLFDDSEVYKSIRIYEKYMRKLIPEEVRRI